MNFFDLFEDREVHDIAVLAFNVSHYRGNKIN